MIRDRWKDSAAKGLSGVDLLVHGSQLLGAEEDLVLHGGGNTSLKQVEKDHAGRSVRVMRVKGSGGDLKSIGRDGFPGVRLDELPALRRRKEMTDAEMVAYLGRCLVEPEARRPSIETLLHGFLPDPAIFHSHADSILALTNNPAPERHVRAALGDGFVLVPYRRPGFALSKLVAEYREAHPKAIGAVLLNHGLFTWGADVKTAYRRHVAAVRKAERYLARHRKARPFGAVARAPAGQPHLQWYAHALSAPLRGLLATPLRVVVRHEGAPEVLEFSRSARAAEMCRIGPATPDHLLHTKRLPCFVPATDPSDWRRTAKEAETAIREWSRSYERWVRKWNREGHAVEDLKPRVVIVRGLGLWTAGRDPAQARVIGDIYRHTIGIMRNAAGLGGFRSLSPREQFRAEYWELELYKRTLLPKEKELSRRVAVITGAARGIGLAIAERFLAEGACVVLHDRDWVRFDAAYQELNRRYPGQARVTGTVGDISKEQDVVALFSIACHVFGGVDIVVSNAGIAPAGAIDTLSLADWERSLAVNATGHFLVAQHAMLIMKAQGTGGAFVFVGSKNVPAPGKDFGAYSAGKAAETQLARVLALEGAPHGIRSNILHPDAVFEDSGLWSPTLRAERAKAQGIGAAEVPDFYRKRSLLGLEVRPRDVAEAALFFASDRSSRITGAWLPVDAGLKEAFPR